MAALVDADGATAAVPLVKMACAGVVEVPTFDEFFVTGRQTELKH